MMIQYRLSRGVILSIKPKYADKILSGHKTVELRRRFPSDIQGNMYIYSTSPIKAIVGQAEITNVVKLSIDDIWETFNEVAYIDKDEFYAYFVGLDLGYVLLLDNPRLFSDSIPLKDLKDKFNFTPPQSFLYTKNDIYELLRTK